MMQAIPPTYISICDATLKSIYDALDAGLEHTKSALAEHDSSLGRTTRKNTYWATVLEKDIERFESLKAILENNYQTIVKQ